ncbi:hypothetical protein [Streptomyces sp. NPDC059272]|uniref:hypothetical protein n=1 Tax=Streptomyces sp. NPDC059272 TaxID=3346800 RepID=UPI0036B8A9B7
MRLSTLLAGSTGMNSGVAWLGLALFCRKGGLSLALFCRKAALSLAMPCLQPGLSLPIPRLEPEPSLAVSCLSLHSLSLPTSFPSLVSSPMSMPCPSLRDFRTLGLPCHRLP